MSETLQRGSMLLGSAFYHGLFGVSRIFKRIGRGYVHGNPLAVGLVSRSIAEPQNLRQSGR